MKIIPISCTNLENRHVLGNTDKTADLLEDIDKMFRDKKDIGYCDILTAFVMGYEKAFKDIFNLDDDGNSKQ